MKYLLSSFQIIPTIFNFINFYQYQTRRSSLNEKNVVKKKEIRRKNFSFHPHGRVQREVRLIII